MKEIIQVLLLKMQVMGVGIEIKSYHPSQKWCLGGPRCMGKIVSQPSSSFQKVTCAAVLNCLSTAQILGMLPYPRVRAPLGGLPFIVCGALSWG